MKKPQKSTRVVDSPAQIPHHSRGKEGLKLYQKRDTSLKASPSHDQSKVRIHPEGKIIDAKYRYTALQDLSEAVEKTSLLPENKRFIQQFIHDARLGKTIIGKQKKKVGVLRQIKYLQDLKKLDTYFRKPFDKIEQTEMEQFILDLEEGRLIKKNGHAYSSETQVAIKNIIIKFYKWLYGANKTVPEIVSWIDTSYEVKDYKAVSKEQVETILTVLSSYGSKAVRNRAIIMFLFDSGARADELLNIRLSHLTVENDDYKVRVEYSKTKKRTISLPLSKKYLDAWLDHHPARDNQLAQLFPLSYKALHEVVRRAGQGINVKLTPHGLRHAAATYWARHLSQYQLCYRLGWSMSSRQPARYIDQEGLDQERVTQVAKTENMSQLQTQNEELHQRLAIMEEQFNRLLEKDIEEVRRIVQMVRGLKK